MFYGGNDAGNKMQGFPDAAIGTFNAMIGDHRPISKGPSVPWRR